MMETQQQSGLTQNERGTLLLLALCTIMVTAMSAIGIVSYIQHDGRSQYQYNNMIKARYVALGAVNKITSKLRETPSLLGSPTSELQAGTIGDDAYAAAYRTLNDGTTRITINGTSQDVSETIYVYAKYLPAIGGSDAFDKSILSENDVNLGGNCSVTENNGTVHSNHNAGVDGSAYLDGNLSAVGTADGDSSNVTGTILSNAPYDAFPKLNYDYYYAIADANKMVISGTFKPKKGAVFNPPGGIIWVDGDVMISSDVTINGCLVATGDIKVTSKASVFTPPALDDGNNAPAVVSLGGDIDMSAQSQLVGLVYAGSGSVKFTGSWKNELRGAICAWDDISLTGGAGLVYDPDVVSNLGNGVISREESVVFLAMER